MRFCSAGIIFVVGLAGALLVGVGGCNRKPEPADLSSPKAAAITFASAMERGDVETAQVAAIAGGMEVDLVDAMTQATSAMRTLGKQVGDKFGEEGRKYIEQKGHTADAATAFKDADVALDGDHAIVTPKNSQAAFPMKLVDGKWKVDIGALLKGQDATQSVPVLRAAAVAAKAVGVDLEAGKITKPEQLTVSMRTKMGEAMAQLQAATTQSISASAGSAPATAAPTTAVPATSAPATSAPAN